jgi:hypothetical protein
MIPREKSEIEMPIILDFEFAPRIKFKKGDPKPTQRTYFQWTPDFPLSHAPKEECFAPPLTCDILGDAEVGVRSTPSKMPKPQKALKIENRKMPKSDHERARGGFCVEQFGLSISDSDSSRRIRSRNTYYS